MAVRSRRVHASETAYAAGFTTLYTVPADRTLLLKDAMLQPLTAGNQDCGLFVRTGNARCWVLRGTVANPGGLTASQREVVLQEGDVIELYSAAPAAYRVWASGSLLAGDPA